MILVDFLSNFFASQCSTNEKFQPIFGLSRIR